MLFRSSINLKQTIMSAKVKTLEPWVMWNLFADLNNVPRGSKKESRAIQFIKDFGSKLELETIEDEIGNVIIKKPASVGMENRTTVVLQSHIDMVHQKNANTEFDFDTQGIQMIVDGDWVKAEGTTLGADNGIGVASAMAILASDTIEHPPIEALFTVDEETGMTGANGLKGGLLDAGIMLNLDTEDDDELTIGCAGGIDVNASGTYTTENSLVGMKGYKLTVRSLTGGHSGMDIHRGRGNANKLMNRVMYHAAGELGLRISSIDGGGLRNAIPRESFAEVAVPGTQTTAFEDYMREQRAILKNEYSTTDPGLEILLESIACPAEVVAEDRKSTRLNSSHIPLSRMPSSA